MTTPPVTGEIEARLKHIAAEERSKITAARNTVSFMLQNDDATLESMRRAYALDRASGDGVRDALQRGLVYVEATLINLAGVSVSSPEKKLVRDDAARIKAALSAVSIPRGEVDVETQLENGTLHLEDILRDAMIEGPFLYGGRWCVSKDAALAGMTAIAKLKSAPLPPAGGWRDMNSAPVDNGQCVLVTANSGGTVGEAWCDPERNEWYWAQTDYSESDQIYPTAWQPLPAPPASGKETT